MVGDWSDPGGWGWGVLAGTAWQWLAHLKWVPQFAILQTGVRLSKDRKEGAAKCPQATRHSVACGHFAFRPHAHPASRKSSALRAAACCQHPWRVFSEDPSCSLRAQPCWQQVAAHLARPRPLALARRSPGRWGRGAQRPGGSHEPPSPPGDVARGAGSFGGKGATPARGSGKISRFGKERDGEMRSF